MFPLLLFAAALLAVYLGYRFSQQKEPQSPPPTTDHADQPNPQSLASHEPTGKFSFGIPNAEITSEVPSPNHFPPAAPTHFAPPPPARFTPPPSTPSNPFPDLGNYQFPTLDLLERNSNDLPEENNTDLENQKNQIVHTLREFDIALSKITTTAGPAMTLYEIVPAAGIRIARILELEEDLAFALAAPGLRLITPIPGKGTIGIEVPNAKRRLVTIRDVFEDKNFQETTFTLPIALGKNSGNTSAVFDLAAMPHLFLTGATGQGKSVSLHAMLLSLLYKKRPSELKLVLVDLKQIELSAYNDLSNHFLAGVSGEAPIITDPRKAAHALNALCIEMDNRYDLMKPADARNIKEYNHKIELRQLPLEQGHQYLPMLVVAIDDAMDLLMTYDNEAKAPIFRLTEGGRAVGIHLILATSRPLKESLANELLQNIPARATFKLGSGEISKTILNATGAEKLTRPGDMLLSFENEITHLAAAFVSPDEIAAVIRFIADQQGYPDIYPLPELIDQHDLEAQSFDLADLDPLFEEAARLIVVHQLGSTSLIQRNMKLGYNRAGRLMEQLEAAGIVGPASGSQPRDVLIKSEMELDQYLNP